MKVTRSSFRSKIEHRNEIKNICYGYQDERIFCKNVENGNGNRVMGFFLLLLLFSNQEKLHM